MDLTLSYIARLPVHLYMWSIVELFFSEVITSGVHNVPNDRPIIFCSTHPCMTHDGALLWKTVPTARPLSCWASKTYLSNSVIGRLLTLMGAVPVYRVPRTASERKLLDENRDMFRNTVDKLKSGVALVIFPEGCSYTEPNIVRTLPGAAWTLIEYQRLYPEDIQPAIVPVTLSYSAKSKARSRVHFFIAAYSVILVLTHAIQSYVKYCPPITLDSLPGGFEHGTRNAKELARSITAVLHESLVDNSIHAPDWESSNAAFMAYRLLSPQSSTYDWTQEVQQLVSTLSSPVYREQRAALSNYFSLLENCLFVDGDIFSAGVPLPVLSSSLIHPILFLTFFLWPAYFVGWLGSYVMTPAGKIEGIGPYKSLYAQGGFLMTACFASIAATSRISIITWYHFPFTFAAIFLALYLYHRLVVDTLDLHYRRGRTGICLLVANLIPSTPLDLKELAIYQAPPTYLRNKWLPEQPEHPQIVRTVDIMTRVRITRWHLDEALAAARESLASLPIKL
ncbi:hypothetical protein DL96DRAFT_1765770 [Flagelloscypha sp. PMI_526]|nr:hypothetical protein DL96DRAFT_1765770 [Flagelloscypha sp. PMI_526]